MLKKKVSWLLSFVLVLTLALSFSFPSCADGSRVWGESFSFSGLHITGKNTGVGSGTYPNTFIRLSDEEWPGSSHISNIYFDFYCPVDLKLFDTSYAWDGYIIDVIFWGDRFDCANIGDFTLALGTNEGVSADNTAPIVNRASWTDTRMVFEYDCHKYGYGPVYLWFLGRSAHYWNIVSSTGSSSPHYASFDVDLYASFSVYPYRYSSASSSDIQNQTTSINNSITNQTNSINNNINQATQDQTNTLTGGYDNSGMENTNQQLADSLASYDQMEAQVTDQSVGYIDAVTFFDPTTHLQLMSSVIYASTFLQNLFVALGDWSVLVVISLSLVFALMLIGWFKYRK